MLRTGLAVATAFALASGCGSSAPPQKPDATAAAPDASARPDAAAAGVDAFASSCGQPGDVGNELGVGKFCATLTDCSGNKQAGLCSNLGDSTTFFCTKFCSVATGAADCGTGTTCTCNNQNQCGCTPNTCL